MSAAIGGVRVLHSSECANMDNRTAVTFLTRADEIGVVFFKDDGSIEGIWCDFNPYPIAPLRGVQ